MAAHVEFTGYDAQNSLVAVPNTRERERGEEEGKEEKGEGKGGTLLSVLEP